MLKSSCIERICPKSLQKVEPMSEELVYYKDLSEEPSKMCICPKRTQSRRRDLSEEPLKIQDLHVNRRIFPAPSVMHAQDFLFVLEQRSLSSSTCSDAGTPSKLRLIGT